MPKDMISEIYGLVKTRGNREQFSLFTIVMSSLVTLSPAVNRSLWKHFCHLLSLSRLVFPVGWPPVQAGRAWGSPGTSLIKAL